MFYIPDCSDFGLKLEMENLGGKKKIILILRNLARSNYFGGGAGRGSRRTEVKNKQNDIQ